MSIPAGPTDTKEPVRPALQVQLSSIWFPISQSGGSYPTKYAIRYPVSQPCMKVANETGLWTSLFDKSWISKCHEVPRSGDLTQMVGSAEQHIVLLPCLPDSKTSQSIMLWFVLRLLLSNNATANPAGLPVFSPTEGIGFGLPMETDTSINGTRYVII